MARTFSFDVFDTVLTRTLGSPRQVFVETGRRLRRNGVVEVEPEVYAAAREEALRDLTVDVALHPTLRQVCVEVAARLALPGAVTADLVSAELTVESDVCRAVPGWPERVAQRRRESGRGVVFVSDTQLPHEFLQGLLTCAGLFQVGDRLFTSSAERASKQDGALYDVVAAALGTAPGELCHIGDDRWSDVAHARLHGWQAHWESGAHLNAHERRLEEAGASTDGMAPRMAAASRTGRLAAQAEGVDPALAAISAGVAMPLLAGFALWVLRQARLLQLNRLYFVSRDGEVFREVALALAAGAGAGEVECRYLYGSRQAWQLASQATAAPGELWLPDRIDGAQMSVHGLLRLVDLTPADAYAITLDPLFAAERADLPLGETGWTQARQLLAAGPLAGEAGRRARARSDLLLRYLDQEGVTAPGRVGLVDVGWTGRATRSLEDVLRSADRPLPTAHLSLGLLGPAPTLLGPDLYARSQGWLVDVGRGRLPRTGREDAVMVVEIFTMGTEGHTTGFAESGGRIQPVLADTQNPAARGWDLAGYRRALDLAVRALKDGPPPDPRVDLRAVVWAQLLAFWRRPTTAEAVTWGARPYGDDFGNATSFPLATPLTSRRVLTRLGLGPRRWREPTFWLEGTLTVSPQPWRTLLRAADRGQQLARRLPRVRARLRAERAMRRPD